MSQPQGPIALENLLTAHPPTPLAAAAAEATQVAAAGLAAFAAEVRRRIEVERPHSLAAATEGNRITVQPGGKTFATISEALASIQDASLKKQYVCYIGAGTYTERVVCKPWVFLQGEGPENTIITAPAGFDFNDKGTVIGASNSAIQNLAVVATGTGWGCFATAVACVKAVNFDIENCFLQAVDPQGGANLWTLTIDYQTGAAGSVVYLAYTSVLATVQTGSSQGIGLLAVSGSVVQLTESKLGAQGGAPGWGGASAGGSSLTLYDSFAGGQGFSLNMPDTISTCVATHCQLDGPVGTGVVVNP